MKIPPLLVMLVTVYYCCSCRYRIPGAHAVSLQPSQWGYTGDESSDKWPDIYTRWCSGRRQSPISIAKAESVYDESLFTYTIREPQYTALNYRVANNGHTVLVHFNNALANLSLSHHERDCLRPNHIHWHWGSNDSVGSEHWLDGKRYPLEGHLVMWDCRIWDTFEEASNGVDGLAVLGILYEIGEAGHDSSSLDAIVAKFNQPLVASCDQCTNESYTNPGIELAAFNIRDLLPSDIEHYYMYYGSTTTPDCRENVLWTVFQRTVTISRSVMQQFRSLQMPADKSGRRAQMWNNFRSPQPLNPPDPPGARRQLSRSFPDSLPVTSGSSPRATVRGGYERLLFLLIASSVAICGCSRGNLS